MGWCFHGDSRTAEGGRSKDAASSDAGVAGSAAFETSKQRSVSQLYIEGCSSVLLYLMFLRCSA